MKAVLTKIYMRESQKLQYQSLPNMLELVRVGGNTASNFYVIHGTSGKKKNLLNKLMNYVAIPPNLPSLVYGREIKAVPKTS